MDAAVREEQARIVANAPMPMLMVDLATRRVVEASEELLTLTGVDRDDLVGTDSTRFLKGGPSPALPLLATGQIDGYEATRILQYPDGREARAHVWAHSFGTDRPPLTAVFVVDELDGQTQAQAQWSANMPGATVLGSVDADWRVDRVSADVRALLGYEPQAVTGASILGAVHPGDAADLLTGLGHARRSGETVILRLRIATADGGWCWCRAWAAPVGDSAAFSFMLRPAASSTVTPDLAQELNERLARIAYEVNAATALTTTSTLPPANVLPGLIELTAREWQVVTALQSGSRAAEVAQLLRLAPSTVRNHLASVYRKLGVGSQVELLAALNRPGQPRQPA